MRIILVASVGTVKRLRVSLGTLVAIEATADAAANIASPDAEAVRAGAANPLTAESAINRAFEAIERVNRLMHPTAEGSDLARINHAPLHVPTRVHVSVGQLLNLARRISALTDGVFDPCTPAQPGRLKDIQVSADETEVVCHARVALDFGGFAKGYAVDCAIEALMAGGCTSGLVNAGGDLRVFGQRSEPVFVRAGGGELINMELTDAALAVSDATAQQRPQEHQGYYMRTPDDHQCVGGIPRHDRRKVSTTDASAVTAPSAQTAAEYATTYAVVIASRAVVADALAKCVLLCLPSAAARVLGAFGATQPLPRADSADANEPNNRTQ
jgi:thiamine biosynthesis lipoprotein